MSSIYQRFFLSKLTLAILIIFSIYILLRTIAFFVHQPIPLSGDYFSFEGKQVRYVCKGSGNPYVFFESGYKSLKTPTVICIYAGKVRLKHAETLKEYGQKAFLDRVTFGG